MRHRDKTPLEIARELDAMGLNCLPAKSGGKAPTVPWQQFQNIRTSDKLAAWFAGTKPRNYWINTGAISGVVVLDCDSEGAEKFWRAELGEILDQTTCVKTSKGHHYYFRLEPGDRVASWSRHDEEASFDVRADGTGVIVPPSVHETGLVYEWLRGPDAMQPLPKALRGAGKQTSSGGGGGVVPARSMLSKLLESPAKAGGRNDWLARVAGHYAKEYRTREDAYRVQCQIANSLLEPPLDEREFTKTIDSVWRKEQAKGETLPNPDNGFLIAGDHTLMTVVKVKRGEETLEEMRPWSNFDIKALGVVEDENASRVYDVVVLRKRQNDERSGLLPSAVLADGRKLAAWLAEFGVVVTPPIEREMTGMRDGARLQLYLESQEPSRFQVVPCLGWHGDGFICHEGVIRASGMHGFEGRKPSPLTRQVVNYNYGMIDPDVAREVLNEVLTFHHPEVASVFGSWWAACLLKSQVFEMSSLFPFMALEAPSESGKTTGFFAKMIQLNGNKSGQNLYTTAALRDVVAAHNSGIAWVDDADRIDNITEILRAATGEGTISKKGEDHLANIGARLVAPMVISGEGLGISEEKALRDRAVMLTVPSPTDRRSVHDRTRPQWDDIVALTRRFPDLTVMAGNMVQMALQHADVIQELPRLRAANGRRFGDKIAIVRAGSRLLASMTGDPSHVDIVDYWVDHQEDTGEENRLTLAILPRILALTGRKETPTRLADGMPPSPVLVRKDGVWFSVMNTALWWYRYKQGRVSERTETLQALEAQMRALRLGRREDGACRRFKIDGRDNEKATYWRLTDELAAQVLARGDNMALSPGDVPLGSDGDEEGLEGTLDTPERGGR